MSAAESDETNSDEVYALHLVKFLDAIVHNDPTAYRVAKAEEATQKYVTCHWYNYFCHSESHGKIELALVLYDSPEVRLQAQREGVDEFVDWGWNPDPVTVCSADEMVQLLHGSDKPVKWKTHTDFEVSAVYEVVREHSESA